MVSIDEQLAELKKGLAELIQEDELRDRIIQKGQLTVKAGFDPTAPDLHLGHTVLLRKMRHFQKWGHRVVFLIGDMTALIGDPTGRNTTRPPMTYEEIYNNAETYKSQVFKILDPDKTEIRYNHEWLENLKFDSIVHLCSKYTLARMLERDDFTKRYKAGVPILIHELLYPLAQAYDSVNLQCDVELGGTDQKFNLLVGREIQRNWNQPPQIVATTPLLEGTDGVDKMSKSKGNYIGITEAPEEMFRKVMSINDTLMLRYYELLTDKSDNDIASLKYDISSGRIHPKEAKKCLAESIVKDFWGESAAQRSAEEWERSVARGEVPSDIATVKVSEPRINKLLVQAGLASSVSEADRLIKAGAVEVAPLGSAMPHRVELPNETVPPGEYVFRVGKKWKRVQV